MTRLCRSVFIVAMTMASTVSAKPLISDWATLGPWEIRSFEVRGSFVCYVRRLDGKNALRLQLDNTQTWFASYPAFAPTDAPLAVTFEQQDRTDQFDMISSGKMAKSEVTDDWIGSLRSAESLIMRYGDKTHTLAIDGLVDALDEIARCQTAQGIPPVSPMDTAGDIAD